LFVGLMFGVRKIQGKKVWMGKLKEAAKEIEKES
jgi:hypothetical protein